MAELKKSKVQVYRSRNGWRWRVRSRNGQITASSGEAYYSKSNALRAARKLATGMGCMVVIAT